MQYYTEADPCKHSRWFRLLFSREFKLPGLLNLWDALFAVFNRKSSSNVVEFVAVAFLLQMRDDCKISGAPWSGLIRILVICERDYNGCMTMLMRNSAKLPPHALVSQAERLRENLSTETTLEILRENDKLRGKPPRLSLSDGLGWLNEMEGVDQVTKNRPPHRRSDGFADVWKSPQFRELNKTIAGVMKNVQVTRISGLVLKGH